MVTRRQVEPPPWEASNDLLQSIAESAKGTNAALNAITQMLQEDRGKIVEIQIQQAALNDQIKDLQKNTGHAVVVFRTEHDATAVRALIMSHHGRAAFVDYVKKWGAIIIMIASTIGALAVILKVNWSGLAKILGGAP